MSKEKSFEQGFFEGKKLGYAEGFNDGFESGYERGFSEGKAAGFNEGSLSVLTMDEHKHWHEFLELMKKYQKNLTISGEGAEEILRLLRNIGFYLKNNSK